MRCIGLATGIALAAWAALTPARGTASEAEPRIGPGEGLVDIVAWPGYIERGETDPKFDWVTDFEKATGCQVRVKVAGTSDEMVALMNEGGFDLATVLPDALFDPTRQGSVCWRIEALDVPPLLPLGQLKNGVLRRQDSVFDKDQPGHLGQARQVIGQGCQVLFLSGREFLTFSRYQPRQQAIDNDEAFFGQERNCIAGVTQFS